MIHIGCTDDHSFLFPYAAEDVSSLFVTYQQSGVTVLEKTLSDCTIEYDRLFVTLSREETLQLQQLATVRMQISGTFMDGTDFISDVMRTVTGEYLRSADAKKGGIDS